MKNGILLLAMVFVIITVPLYPQVYASLSPVSTHYEQVESNYLKGLNSDVHNLRLCCAYFLGEMKSQKAMIPLMEMFRSEKNDAKLVAAWSLLKIGDPRGVYLVKSGLDAKECDNIKCMLHFLYMDYCLRTNGRIDKD
jgi:hypothetical protein